MDIRYTKTHLHPQIKTFLFQHFAIFTSIFRSVLGLLEIDYIGVALLNQYDEFLLFSSKPSIEWNLIENDLWQFDHSYHSSFFDQHEAKIWGELYHEPWRDELYYFKQKVPGLNFGFSIPSNYQNSQIVYSFATKSTRHHDIQKIIENPAECIRIGQFCLQKILNAIILPDLFNTAIQNKSFLKLIINNEPPKLSKHL